MKSLHSFGSLLLLSSALVAPQALAQGAAPSTPPASTPPVAAPDAAPAQAEEQVEISSPGADNTDSEIVVTGRFTPNIIEQTPEVISVLSAADIARTGEGDIAGALQRVTGLSVVGGRFVYVRGLGERYSLALLNGSPLPSPEPLRRVVPLDLFPTNILASSVVQKTYSVNYPGEFGGGVINLTTKSAPEEAFVAYGFSVGGNTETTGELGYTYYGSRSDFTGFDNGARDVPAPLAAAMATGNPIVAGTNFTRRQIQDITASLANSNTNLIQRNSKTSPDYAFDITGGKTFVISDDFTLGLIGAFGYKHGWQTKGGVQQLSTGVTADPSGKQIITPNASNFQFLSTENRIVVNGLLGLTGEFSGHKVRWTNLFIRDTLKEARIQTGIDENNVGQDLVTNNYTSWFERQLIDTQLVGEFDFDPLSVDIRASYAKSQRESPYERVNSYRFSTVYNDFFNDLRTNGTQSTIAFSDLSDQVYAGGIDLAYKLATDRKIRLSAGYAYFDNTRNSTRRDFRYLPVDALNPAVTQQRPDYLLSDYNVYTYNILLTETSGNFGAAVYDAGLKVHAGYGQADVELFDDADITFGVRYESGKQFVRPLDLRGATIGETRVENNYFLPAATLTYDVANNMQIRIAASRTIARPQFRELAPQQYLDSEVDRTFFGNPYLVDSELTNYDMRYEWYFAKDQRFSLAGFFKKIERPIETIAFQQGGTFFTTFANAPSAILYGGELEVQKYFPLDTLSSSSFFASRRAIVIGNYTYSKSRIRVSPGDTTISATGGGVSVPATQIFSDGTPLTGQSDHLVNIQLGLEDTDRLSQQTLLLTYSSERVTNRGPSGQPDLVERPGLQIDFVARQGFTLWDAELEFKFEARNLTNADYRESQSLNGTQVLNNFFERGRSFSIGINAKF